MVRAIHTQGRTILRTNTTNERHETKPKTDVKDCVLSIAWRCIYISYSQTLRTILNIKNSLHYLTLNTQICWTPDTYYALTKAHMLLFLMLQFLNNISVLSPMNTFCCLLLPDSLCSLHPKYLYCWLQPVFLLLILALCYCLICACMFFFPFGQKCCCLSCLFITECFNPDKNLNLKYCFVVTCPTALILFLCSLIVILGNVGGCYFILL